ncbi:coiled-coil and C2 domain containing 2A isoform X3 [Rhodnius prolixus]
MHDVSVKLGEEVVTAEETTFISDNSPVHSSPGRSDKELLKSCKAAAWKFQGPTPSSPLPRIDSPADKKKDVGSSKQSEISSLRSTTPQSDNRSYRERIRERVQAAKERAMVTSQLKSRVQSRVKSPTQSKSEELDKEDEEVEEAMKKHKMIRAKWKLASASMQVSNIQTGYNFFSRSWEETVSAEKKIVELEGSPPKGEEVEEEKMMISDVLGSKEEDWLPLFTYEPPTITNWVELKQKQVGMFFCPSSSPVPIEEKLEPDTVPRFMEDEGLYVGKRTKVSWKRQNKLEQRIMAMGSERFWFGEDGDIKGSQDPLEYSQIRLDLEYPLNQSLVEFKPATLTGKETVGPKIEGDSVCTLEIDCGELVFKHHPLFSKEHCLGERLCHLCDGLIKIRTPGDRLSGRLEALTNSRKHSMYMARSSGERLHTAAAAKYRADIKEIRAKWLAEKKKERELLMAVLETWRDLKQLRIKQGYCNTTHRLQIVTREPAESEEEWNKELKSYLEEMEEEAEEEYKVKLEEYKVKLKDWKKLREERTEDIETDDDGEDSKEPEKPHKMKSSKLREKAMEELGASLRPPGEPIIEIKLFEDGEITETTNNILEQERRAAVLKCQTWLALRHNGREVDRIKGCALSQGFITHFHHRFSLRLSNWPRTLSIQLVETGCPQLFGKKPLAEIFIPMPARVNTECAQWYDYEFSCGHSTGSLKHAGVGTGLKEKGSTEPNYTTGTLSVRSGWAYPLPTLVHPTRPIKETKPTRTDIQKLKEWAEQVQLDPNDPSNADLIEYIKNTEERELTKCKTGIKEASLEFCTEEDILKNPRLKLLMLRDSGQPEFRNMRNVPLNEREIPKDIFKMYERRTSGKDKKKVKGQCFDRERTWGRQYLDEIREEVIKNSRQTQNRSFRDIVHEEPVPDLGTLGLTIMRWIQPKRPLRPRRKPRKKLPIKNLVGQDLEIIVNIGRAFEVPVRKEACVNSEEMPFELVAVRPFIEITFQGERRRTTTADGANPTWNQYLHIPVKTPSGLHAVRDSLHIHLYDETLVDLVEDERLRETNIHQRLERHWLGSLRIPFVALFTSTRIEGTFQLYSPPILLGYTRESKEFRDATFLTVFIIVHPPLHPPTPLQEKLKTSEETVLEQHLEQWLFESTKEFPNRHVPSLVLDSSGKSVCITRYFRPIPPPEISVGEKTTPEMAARFVSMIPVIQSHMLYPGQLDIWLTANQILEVSVCESGCHAALLACYLSALGLRSSVALGTGTPGGPGAYVLTTETSGSVTLWDPTTGRKFSPTDSFSPLTRLHCIVDESNIWINSQKEDLLSQIDLDLTKRTNWWPAFGRSLSAPTGSVQPQSMVYKETPHSEVNLLQDRLEKLLRNALTKLRPTTRTIWNRYCTASLRRLLPGLEKATWSGKTSTPPDHIQELQHILSSYKMCGFPINMPYTSPAELVEAVKSTGVHLNDAPDIEFAVAVYVHAFPSNVLSIWVYVASLLRRR